MHRLPEKLVLETQKLSNWYAWIRISTKRKENHPRYRSFPPIVCCILYNRQYKTRHVQGPLWSWSYGSWIYNYICNQCISPLTLWVRISLMASCTRYNIMWSRFSMTCRKSMVYPDTLVSSINKTDHNDITAILLKVAVNTIALTNILYIKTISALSNRFVFYCCIWLFNFF